MRKFAPAAILGAAHLVIHFSLPVVDLIMHAALLGALWFGARSNA